MDEILMNVFSGFLGSAVFGLVIYFGKIIWTKIKEKNIKIATGLLKHSIVCFIDKEIRFNSILRELGLFLFTLVIYITLMYFYLIMVVLSIKINNNWVSTGLSWVLSGASGCALGYLFATTKNLYRLLTLDNDSLSSRINKYIKSFRKEIDEDSFNLLNQLNQMLINNSDLEQYFYIKYSKVINESIENNTGYDDVIKGIRQYINK